MADPASPYHAARIAFGKYAALNVPDEPENTMAKTQVRLSRWQNGKFRGTGTSTFVAGFGEEIGEALHALIGCAIAAGSLNHSTIKFESKIRGMDDLDKYKEALADGIADAMIFLAQACTACRLDFETLFVTTAHKVMERKVGATPNE